MQDDPLIEPNTAVGSVKCRLHAVLVRVFDTGVLILGESGIGKSECALELIARGHQVIADDSVEVFAVGETLEGRAPEVTRHLIEIRGLGIINLREVFGHAAVAEASPIDLCIELTTSSAYNPLEDAFSKYEIAGVMVPKVIFPVGPGRNLATLIETAVRLHRVRGDLRAAQNVGEALTVVDVGR
ncbi:MAG TPA: hypothetical protein VMZ26_03495 [Pyrinomonadaceae bacterium]|nr:hypothetical protein [Pyrinomonadaceae bacterium]